MHTLAILVWCLFLTEVGVAWYLAENEATTELWNHTMVAYYTLGVWLVLRIFLFCMRPRTPYLVYFLFPTLMYFHAVLVLAIAYLAYSINEYTESYLSRGLFVIIAIPLALILCTNLLRKCVCGTGNKTLSGLGLFFIFQASLWVPLLILVVILWLNASADVAQLANALETWLGLASLNQLTYWENVTYIVGTGFIMPTIYYMTFVVCLDHENTTAEKQNVTGVVAFVMNVNDVLIMGGDMVLCLCVILLCYFCRKCKKNTYQSLPIQV